MSDVSIVVNQGALTALLRGPDGAVAADLARRGIRVATAAQRLAPVDTGRLRASITSEVGSDAQGLFADVGTDVSYAAYVELGTRYMAAMPYLRPALQAAQ